MDEIMSLLLDLFLHFVSVCCLVGEKNIESEKFLSGINYSFLLCFWVWSLFFPLVTSLGAYIYEYCVNCCIHTNGGPLKDKNYANRRAAEGSFVAWKLNS